MKAVHLPLRLAVGAFFLNSGLTKRTLEGEAAEGLHGMATGAIPQLRRFEPKQFAKLLSYSEVALGAALVVPFIPSALVGLGLTAFGAGLMQLYLKTPGLREPNSLRPSQAGIAIAKDSWLVGAGLTLVLDDLTHRKHRR
ncbi:DoxX protein [Micromonospora krabiensis]|uniref:DoxX protein n=1 Tax=Micromonospora krabiensis TaxID=307121 RepID=A0A1C3MYT8_9ACTN|nr:DoxX protein [Micromonospora krabiensis]